MMKLTLHSFTWHVMVVFLALFATRSSTVVGMASGNTSNAHSMDNAEGAGRGANVSSSLRRLPTFTGEVTGFELIDVTSKPNKVWQTLFNGTVALGPNRPYSIKANVAGAGIGSVVMTLNTAPPAYENLAPYALCRDNYSNLDLISCGTSVYGTHVITAKACSGANGNGDCTAPRMVQFKIWPGVVTGFELYDVTSKPNTLWQTLYYNAEAIGPSRPYSIKANVLGGGIRSVAMTLTSRGSPEYNIIENMAPYTLCRDNGDLDFVSCGMSGNGLFIISAKACSEFNGQGFCAPELATSFGIYPRV
jgi:hypothetical protein